MAQTQGKKKKSTGGSSASAKKKGNTAGGKRAAPRTTKKTSVQKKSSAPKKRVSAKVIPEPPFPVEPAGKQIDIEEVLEETKKAPKKRSSAKIADETAEKPAEKNVPAELSEEKTSLKPRKRKKKEVSAVIDDEDDEMLSESPENDEVSWSQQVSSILFGVLSLFMFALIIFKGDNLWTVLHNFLFGIFGNMAIVWNALLVYSGYMFAKQKGAMRILEIIRSASGLIVFIDVLSYILIQSNGYRDVNNQLTYGIIQLIVQIYRDGSRLGGTGLIGGLIGEILIKLLGKTGGAIVTVLVLFAFIMLISHTTPVALIENIKKAIVDAFSTATAMFRDNGTVLTEHFDDFPDDEEYGDEAVEYEALPDDIIHFEAEPSVPDTDMIAAAEESEATGEGEAPASGGSLLDQSLEDLINKVSAKKKKKKTKAEQIQEQTEEFAKEVEHSTENSEPETAEKEYQYPPVKLLIAPKNTNEEDDRRELTETADMLIHTLEEYGVKASISDISRGPTVTRYEIKPAPGVKINKITNLSNDIALRLAAQSIRIEAPIPGKPAVGIEIPNQNKQMVRIREILGSRQFAEAKGALTVALGKDIEGNIVLCDLTKMPHLLIAGSTGSGKSVCVNSMLMSLLYKYSPKEVRMVLIDPKSVEFDMYNGIPHLLVPVVCEPKKAAGALQWAVSEMLKRYGMLKEHGARNIDNYNRLAEETGEFEKLCRIVIVIDEMADLMIASPKEVEDAIARLAAMARAAGMYMVLATQRPSVDVITGTIKNNIPSRIALAVSSQIDSRTILDEGGAENLIGYGDMLYHPMGSSKHVRVQGCFVDDMEVDRVIRFVKQNGSAEYDDSIADEIERNSMENAGENPAEFDGKDEYFDKAVEVVTEAGQASTSMLQRRLGVGYARAGRIIDQLEEQGVIGPYEGSKPRAVLITRAQWLEMTMSKIPSGKNDPIVRSHSQFAAQTLDNGHEEITARQSEFFNANEVDDDEYNEAEESLDYGEAADVSAEETDDDFIDENESSADAQEADAETLEAPMEEAFDAPDVLPEEDDDNESDETDSFSAFEIPRVRDLFGKVGVSSEWEEADEDESEEPDDSGNTDDANATDELPEVKDLTAFLTNRKDSSQIPDSEEESDDGQADKALPRVRDFTQFFLDDDDDSDEDDEAEYSGNSDEDDENDHSDDSDEDNEADYSDDSDEDDETEYSGNSDEDDETEYSGNSDEDEQDDVVSVPLQVRDFTRFFDDDEDDDNLEDFSFVRNPHASGKTEGATASEAFLSEEEEDEEDDDDLENFSFLRKADASEETENVAINEALDSSEEEDEDDDDEFAFALPVSRDASGAAQKHSEDMPPWEEAEIEFGSLRR